MILGIDCSRFASPQPTGVELYTDRIVDGIVRQADQLGCDEIRLYVKNAIQVERLLDLIEESGQKNVQVRLIEHQRLWTVFWFSWEMLRRPVDVLFVPSHTLSLRVSKKSVLTVHGVEALVFSESLYVVSALAAALVDSASQEKGYAFYCGLQCGQKRSYEVFRSP